MNWWLRVFLLFVPLGPGLSGCMCFTDPLCGRNAIDPRAHVLFVGRVIEVWPSRQAIADEDRRLTLEQLRALTLRRWRGVLTPEEERSIRAEGDKILLLLKHANRQRVRFEISEVFSGPPVREVFTDSFSCGFPFQPGQSYLVSAFPQGPRFSTGACSGTGRVDSHYTLEDLKFLRARKAGHPLPPRIYGRIDLKDLRPDTRVLLIKDGAEQTTQIGPDGTFAFDHLDKSKYLLRVQDARGRDDLEIDLRPFGCFEAFPGFYNGWSIVGGPNLIPAGPPARQLEEPVLPAPRSGIPP